MLRSIGMMTIALAMVLPSIAAAQISAEEARVMRESAGENTSVQALLDGVSHAELERARALVAGIVRPDLSDLTAAAEGVGMDPVVLPAAAPSELRIFVSLTMPDELLLRYLDDADRYGGVVVIAGVLDGSLKRTMARLQDLVERNEDRGGAVIDPKAFETFGVTQVPAIVVSEGMTDVCLSADCEYGVARYDIIRGSVSVRHALERFRSDGDLPELAEYHLSGGPLGAGPAARP